MLIRISKTDVKAAMLARLHGAIEILIDFLKRWQNLTPHALYIGVPISPVMETQEMVHRKMISAAYQVLKLWASKSGKIERQLLTHQYSWRCFVDNNLLCLYRAGLIDVIASVVQSKPTVSTVPQHGSASAWANILEALAVVAKNKNALLDVLRVFGGMTFFIKACSPHFGSTTLWKCQELGEAQVDGVGTDESDREKPLNFSKRTKGDNLLKGALRFLKTAVETDEGKKAFIDAGGQDALISVLGSIVQELDMSSTVTSQNSIPGMVMAVLRAGANPSELPFQERMQARSFQLPPPLDSPEEDVFSSIEKDSQFVKRMEALLPEQHLNDAFVASPLFASESHTNRGHGTPSLCPVRMVQPANRAIDRHKMQVCPSEQELQYRRPPSALKKVLFEQTSQIRKGFNPNGSQQSLVYDVMDQRSAEVASKDPLTLQFDSRFESGNLQFAVKVSNTEYNLILQSDINTEIGKHNQWFYFSVRKMVANCVYRFNIINMSKNSSQFNYGMQPVMYSKCENCWRRIGDTVCYFRNNYRKNVEAEEVGDEKADAQESNAESSKAAPTYSTLMFTVVFKQENDTCFLAYHYPYTLSDLQDFLNASYAEKTFHMRCRWQELCRSLGNNRCDLLTITDFGPESVVSSPVESRRYIPLMARVHPGESNASYIMKGIISFLLSDDDQASFLRKKCVFKIVPMLNPDGVVNGSHRCSLAGVDLNRQWVQPSERQTPTIYWTKTLWRYLVHRGIRPFVSCFNPSSTNKTVATSKLNFYILTPKLSCDFHGHSRRKNVFVFGVENGPGIHEGLEKVFPQLMSEVCPVFDLGRSKYNVERSKEATARVVLCRELGVLSSYTLESTFNGFDTGPFKGQQIQIGDLEKVGTDFCRAIFEMILVFDSAGVACLTSTNSGMPQSVNDDISNANWQASGKGFKSKV
ncbi:hypothetical protein BJ742DRAFT_84849 [Cladochytrium replicatum]|nr:hypothetical protein BJ742DRAFT_84849 [Cladochytrium replicatum]